MSPAESHKKYFWIAIVVLALGLFGAWRIASSNSGIDFFHIWGVGTAKAPKLPFTRIYDKEYHPAFMAELREYAKLYPSERLDLWLTENDRLYDSGFHPTGTPFFYTVHAISHGGSPEGLGPDVAFWNFQVFSTLLFVLGCTLSGVAFGLRWTQAVLLTALLLILHRGLHSDIGVANVNRLQCGITGFAIWLLKLMADKGQPTALKRAMEG